jgi:hypothetical protein
MSLERLFSFDREVKMKTRKLLFAGLLLVLVVACGGGGGSGKPAGVVEKVVTAMSKLDVEEASKYMCEEHKSAMQDALSSGFEEMEQMGLDPQELLDAFKINFKDMKYEEKSTEGDKAVVAISGKMSMSFDEEKLKGFFRKAGEASGQPFTAMGGQEAPFEGDVNLVKEGGDWKVCDELDFLNQIDLGL